MSELLDCPVCGVPAHRHTRTALVLHMRQHTDTPPAQPKALTAGVAAQAIRALGAAHAAIAAAGIHSVIPEITEAIGALINDAAEQACDSERLSPTVVDRVVHKKMPPGTRGESTGAAGTIGATTAQEAR